MKRLILLLIALIISANAAYAQTKIDGTIVEQAACPPNVVGTYEQYVEAVKNGYARAIESSKEDGIRLEMPTGFSKRTLSREEFERRKAYTGVDCRRIKYMGKLLAPRIISSGTFADGRGEDDWSVEPQTAEQGRRIVTINKNQGADFIKIYNPSREAYFALVDEAKKQNIPIAGHVPLAITSFDASNTGQRSFEHLGNITRSVSTLEPSVIEQRTNETVKPTAKPDDLSAIPARLAAATKIELETYDAEKAKRLFASFVKNKTWQVPTLATKRPLSLFDDGTFFNDAQMKYITAKELEDWKPENNFFLKYRTPEFIVQKKRLYQKELELTGAMHKAGVPFVTGTDVSGAYTYPDFSLHDELALFVQTEFTPLEAPQAATINSAKLLGLEKSLGTIEKGKPADLILLDANPLLDISNTRKINSVVVNGRLLDGRILDEMLNNVEAEAKKK